MSMRFKACVTVTIILILIAGCGKSEPTASATPRPPAETPIPPTGTLVPTTPTPTQTPISPTDTPLPPTAPPTATPVPSTNTPIPPTAEPDVIGDTWFKTYGEGQDDVGNDVLLADDGGYFIVGATNLEFEPEQQGDIYLIKTNAAGEILWEKTYGGEGYETGTKAFPTSDGGLMISGVTNSFGAGGMDIYLIKVDQDGNELWSETFGGPLDEMGVVWPMDDGGYILGGNVVDPNDVVVDNPGVAGYAGLAGRSNVYLARIDSDGNELWSRTFGGENNVLASSGLLTPDGGFVILATILYFPDNDDDIYLLKVDKNGDEVWSRTWERGMSGGYDLVQTSDGNYLVTGPYSHPDDMDRSIRDFLFVKFDTEGNEIWTSTFGDPDIIDYGHVLAATMDGAYVAAGAAVKDLKTRDEDIAIVKIDEYGQLLWEQIIDTDAHSMFGTLLQHPDGGYVIAGSIFNGRNFDIFMIKTDSQGNVSALTTTSQTVTSLPSTATLTPASPVPPSPVVADIIASLEGLPIDQFFEQSYRQLQRRDPDALVVNGLADEYGVANDRFTDISDAYIRETHQLESAILDLLRAYDLSALSPDQQLSYDIYEWYLDDLVRGHEFMYYDYPVNSMTIWGIQNWLIDFMVSHQPIANKQDAEDYIARLSQIDTWVEQLLEGLKLREQAGVVPPKGIVEESRHQVEQHLHMRGAGSFNAEAIQLYTSFREKMKQVDQINADEAQVLLDAALAEIEDTFIPAFLELRDYLVYLETVATRKSGAWKFPNGEAYYAYILRHQTSTDMSPDEVHELGLAEVARIQAQIQEAAAELGYPQDISLSELDSRLWMDSQLLEGDALLAEYQRLIAEADQAADAYFDLRPSIQVVVETEPFGSGIAYYTSPPLDGSGPGKFFTNLDSAAISYIMPTVTFHETIPGHHFQIALARELDLATFRRELLFNAHAEGWALYAERLAWEMGLYENDPLGNLGRLELELARAARLVVDTGIHAKGWTAQVAADYYAEATGRPTDPSTMHRYIILPGQGCGYTIGMLKILELRQLVMDQLGDQFDIKEFHNVVLGNGSLPLEILERLVQD